MDDDLICNFKKCRKRLNGFAWVTSCSHIFCDEDGNREFGRHKVCPACSTNFGTASDKRWGSTELPTKFDVVRVDLQPSEQYKSMVLAGQRPEVIMEICSRAMSFWTYQAHQERAYQQFCASKAVEKAQQQEGYYEQLVAVNQSEMASLKTQTTSLKKDLESMKTRYNETSDKLMEKSRQFQKLQGMYETLRRYLAHFKNVQEWRSITPALFDSRDKESHPPPLRQHQFELPLGTLTGRDAVLPHGHFEAMPIHRRNITDFTLHPSSSSSSSAPLADSVTISSSSVAQTQANLHLDPSLAAAVTSHAVQHTVKVPEHFTIKMAPQHHAAAHPFHSHGHRR